MAVYSHLFFAGQLSTALTKVYTTPSGLVSVLRDLEVQNNGSAPDSLLIAIFDAPGFANAFFLRFDTVAPGQSRQWTGRVVVGAPGGFGGNSGGQQWNVVMSGYQLTQ